MVYNLLAAIGFIAMGAAVNDLSVASGRSVLGRRGGWIIGLGLLGAALQMGEYLSHGLGMTAWLPWWRTASAVVLVALPFSFRPVIARLKRGRLSLVDKRLTQRALRAETAARTARAWLDLAEESAHLGHWELTVPDNQLIWSDQMYRIHGLWREHFAPRIETVLATFHPLDSHRLSAQLQDAVMQQRGFEIACRLRRPDGEIRHVLLRGAPHIGASGRIESINGIMLDVTDPKRAEARLTAAAANGEPLLEDELTGLADRRQFDLSLGYEFKRAVRGRKPLGMVLVELDHFEAFAAHYGALEADAALRAVAQAVQAVPRRTGDVVARYGESRIAVLLPLADVQGAQRVAVQLLEAVRALGLPNAGHSSGHLTVSCGAAAFAGIDDLYNPTELPRRAEAALAMAQDEGNRVSSYRETELYELTTRRS